MKDCNPVFTDRWETIADIKRRTGITATSITQYAKTAFQAGLLSMKMIGDDTLKIPAFKRRSEPQS